MRTTTETGASCRRALGNAGCRFGAFLLLWLGLACGEKETSIEAEIRSLRILTIPADACSVATVPSSSGTFSVSTGWGFATSMPWPEYSDWVAEQLQPDFLPHSVTLTRLEFVKHLPNDSYFLRLELDPAIPGRIRVGFVARPN